MRPERDDLFHLFPDLPWPGRPSREARMRALKAGVDEWRARAMRNVERQRRAAAAVKKRISDRRKDGGGTSPRRVGRKLV
jgi:hypothetical protein